MWDVPNVPFFDRLTAVVLQGYSPFWIQTRSSDLWYSGADKSIGTATGVFRLEVGFFERADNFKIK